MIYVMRALLAVGLLVAGAACAVNAPVRQVPESDGVIQMEDMPMTAAPTGVGNVGVAVTEASQQTGQATQQGGLNLSWQTVGGVGLGAIGLWLLFTLVSQILDNRAEHRARAATIELAEAIGKMMLGMAKMRCPRCGAETRITCMSVGEERASS